MKAPKNGSVFYCSQTGIPLDLRYEKADGSEILQEFVNHINQNSYNECEGAKKELCNLRL